MPPSADDYRTGDGTASVTDRGWLHDFCDVLHEDGAVVFARRFLRGRPHYALIDPEADLPPALTGTVEEVQASMDGCADDIAWLDREAMLAEIKHLLRVHEDDHHHCYTLRECRRVLRREEP
jgi:hypothetical protein